MQTRGMLTGKTVGDYQLGATFDDDSFGPIYEALHLNLDRSFALRVLSDRFTFASGFEELFWRVAQVMAALDHPNLLTLDDYDIQGAYAYLVTPLVQGITLENWLRLRQGQPAEPGQVIRLFSQALAAFNHAHQAGVTHLGLTPRHILLEPNGRLLVTNFGLPYLAEQLWIAWNGSRSFGDPRYLAPEQFPGRSPTGVSCDLYALGVILFQLLTGALPYEGPPQVILTAKLEEPPSLRVRAPGLPPTLESVVMQALMPAAEERWPDVASFGGAFFLALERSGMPVPQHILAGPTVRSFSLSGGPAAKLLAAPDLSQQGVPDNPLTGTIIPLLPGDYAVPAGSSAPPPSAAEAPPDRRTSRPATKLRGRSQIPDPPPAEPEVTTTVAWSSAGRGRPVPPPPNWNRFTGRAPASRASRALSALVKIILVLLTLGALAGALFYGYRSWQLLHPTASPTPPPVTSPTLPASPTREAGG